VLLPQRCAVHIKGKDAVDLIDHTPTRRRAFRAAAGALLFVWAAFVELQHDPAMLNHALFFAVIY